MGWSPKLSNPSGQSSLTPVILFLAMIELEFIDSPDKNALGRKTFHFDELSIGCQNSHSIILNDPALTGPGLYLHVNSSGLWVKSLSPHHYFSNGKKISGKKLHKKGDQIKLGETLFAILSFKKSLPEGTDFDQLYQQAVGESPQKEKLLAALQEELDRLERTDA